MKHGGGTEFDVVLGALGAAGAGGPDLDAVGTKRLVASTATEVSGFLRMLVAEASLVGRGALLMLGVLGKVEPATTAETDIVFILSCASGANLHRILNVIMPENAAERRVRTVGFKYE